MQLRTSTTARRLDPLRALSAADEVDRPTAVGMGPEPAIGKKIIQLATGDGLTRPRLSERLAVAMIGQPREQITQPSERFHAVGLGAADQRVHRRRPFAAALAANEQIVLAADGWNLDDLFTIPSLFSLFIEISSRFSRHDSCRGSQFLGSRC